MAKEPHPLPTDRREPSSDASESPDPTTPTGVPDGRTPPLVERDALTLTAAPGPEGSEKTRSSADTSAEGEPRPQRGARLPAPLQYRDSARYQIIGEHGRGGLGRVLHARDRELGRPLAIKELLTRNDASELRFFREALITARLEHPGIVPVHEAGRWADGTPFYAMKLVAGRPLKDLITAAHTRRQRLELLPHVIAVADAVAYAHSKSIIHRDLKPSNVIVGDFGETVVIDWGLAKSLSDSDPAGDPTLPGTASFELTSAGAVLGTPAFMAPEQALGLAATVAVDVFALGALLFNVLTSATYTPSTSIDVSCNQYSREIRSILRRALATDPSHRYPTATSFRDDLQAYVANSKVASHDYNVFERAVGIARRHPIAAVSTAIALLTSAVLSMIFAGRLLDEEAKTRKANDRLAATVGSLRAQSQRLILEQARTQLATDPTSTVAWLKLYDGTETSRAQEIAATAAGDGVANPVLRLAEDQVGNLSWISTSPPTLMYSTNAGHLYRWSLLSPPEIVAEGLADPRALVTDSARERALFATQEAVHVYDHKSGTQRPIHAISPPLHALNLVGDAIFVEDSVDGRLLSLPEGRRLSSHRASRFVVSSHDGKAYAVCSSQGTAYVEHVSSSQRTTLGPCSASLHQTVTFSEGGEYVAVASNTEVASYRTSDGKVEARWPLRDATLLTTWGDRFLLATAVGELHEVAFGGSSGTLLTRTLARPTSIAARPDGTAVVSYDNGTLALLRYGQSPVRFAGYQNSIDVLAIADDQYLATTDSHEIRIYSLPTSKGLAVPTAAAFNVAYTSSSTLAMDSQEGNIVVVDLHTSRAHAYAAHERLAVGIVSRGDRILSAGWDGAVRETTMTGSSRLVTRDHGIIRGLAATDDLVLACYSTGVVQLAALADGATVGRWTIPEIPYRAAASKSRFIVGTITGGVYIIDPSTGPRLAGKHEAGVFAVTSIPDLGLYGSVARDGRLQTWSEDGQPLTSFHLGKVCTSISASRNGLIAVGCDQRGISVVDVRSKKRVLHHDSEVEFTNVFMSPSGRFLAVPRTDGRVMLWRFPDLAMAIAAAERAFMTGAAFSPDDRELSVVTASGRAYSWQIADLDFVPRAVVTWAGKSTNAKIDNFARDGSNQ